ncbi:ubiquinone/menaquinone biosynthesis C-methylase UbiE [Salibacterium salarium]|uniref:class I SAM-dependent methyltransferase n=1 Tax=Salibacterium salarium TaxID=284579 RepID=UPI002784CEAF|nr:methyltransferase domain-containing protein [Salibacterium salarium]MDQ0300610.1 ubiquinone/menaquinone biosynthesis C-methylase UbiE [Salibacterium salarium]
MRKTELYAQQGIAMTCRSYTEYKEMFMLHKKDFRSDIVLDVGAGASSFTAALIKTGHEAIAVDPLYNLSNEEMYELGRKEMKTASEKLSEKGNLFNWDYYHTLHDHDEMRNRSFQQFMDQYRQDNTKEKYVPGTLPNLPFYDNTFSFIVCNHFLFLYQEQFDFSFHIEAIKELVRVTKSGGSILIYPLVDFKDERYPHLDKLISLLKKKSADAELYETDFRFLPSASHFLKVTVR